MASSPEGGTGHDAPGNAQRGACRCARMPRRRQPRFPHRAGIVASASAGGARRDLTVAGVPAARQEARARDEQSRRKERPHACHLGLSLVFRSS